MTPLDILKEDLCGQVAYKLPAPIEVGGLTLAAELDDRTAFSQLVVAWDTAAGLLPAEAKAAFMAEPVQIADAAGTLHTLSRLDAMQLLLAYAGAYYARWRAAKTRAAAIAAATTEAEARAAFAAQP